MWGKVIHKGTIAGVEDKVADGATLHEASRVESLAVHERAQPPSQEERRPVTGTWMMGRKNLSAFTTSTRDSQ
jgi:hypothetical protein